MDRRDIQSDSGAFAVTFAVMAVVLLGMAGVALDAGGLYAARREMQTAADAGALAGVRELPLSPGTAQAVAVQYTEANRPDLPITDVTIGSTYGANDTIEVGVSDPAIGLRLVQFLGIETAGAGAHAVAVVASPVGYSSGVMPFGVMSKEPSGTAAFGYEFYESVLLKVAADSGAQGNFHFLSLTNPPSTTGVVGANVIRNQLRNGGTDFPVYVGAEYSTRPGINGIQTSNLLNQLAGSDPHDFFDVVAEPDEAGIVKLLDPGCPRLIICPIIVNAETGEYNWTMSGASDPVSVVGLAWFFLEDWGGAGNDSWVSGRFIRPLTPDEVTSWGPIDPTGAVGYRLID